MDEMSCNQTKEMSLAKSLNDVLIQYRKNTVDMSIAFFRFKKIEAHHEIQHTHDTNTFLGAAIIHEV